MKTFLRDVLMAVTLFASTTATGTVPDKHMWCVGPRYEASEPAATCTEHRINRETKGDRRAV